MNVFVLFVLLGIFQSFEAKFSHRFWKVECGSSKITANNTFCFIKTLNKKLSTLNFGFTLNRIIANGLVNIYFCNFDLILIWLHYIDFIHKPSQD